MRALQQIQALIVDDNRQMRFLIRSLLRAAGMGRVEEAQGAEEALDCMRRVEVDLVLVDWCMGAMDGIAFTRALRLDPASPNPYVAIVMVSAHSAKSRVRAARDAGVNSFLVKPISARSLFHHVNAALTDSRPFVRAPGFFGPDRRWGVAPNYCGPWRRASDEDRAEDLFLDAV